MMIKHTSARRTLFVAPLMAIALHLPTANANADKFHELEHLFEGANIVAGPSIVDCTLSGGTKAECFSISVKAEPKDYTPGPWCPDNISDGPDVAGIWLENNQVYDVDGAFIENLAQFYDDAQWQMYDKATGQINVTDTLESCEAAARPNVDPAYQNHCVQCLPEYMDEDAAVTYFIPLTPAPLSDTTVSTRQAGSGVAFNGIRLDGPAPVDAILGAYTVAPFDDCGGHVNLHVGYHYHIATDCLLERGEKTEQGTKIGVAMDGRDIYTHLDASGKPHTDLDACGGHTLPGGDYHYHAGAPGSNAIVGCFTAEVGCVAEGIESQCDASVSKRPNDNNQGNRPDFAAIAKQLGVSETELKDALGSPPPDIEKAAGVLNVDADKLRQLLPGPGK